MTKGVSVFSVCLMAALAALVVRPAQAQHLHQHGNHFDVHQNVPHGHDAAGHLIDRHGHHIDGHGHHTGSIGVYENGSLSSPYGPRWSSSYPSYSSFYYGSPLYSSSLYAGSLYSGAMYPGALYSGSLYSSPLYSGSQYSGSLYSGLPYSAPLYSAPSAAAAPLVVPSAPGLNAAPPVAGNATRNRIPVPRPAPGQGGTFVLSNPKDSGGPIRYSLNSFAYTINPGELQTVPLDRDWVITFDNGLNKTVTYRLEDGVYDFTVAPDRGWDLVKRTAPAPQPASRRSL